MAEDKEWKTKKILAVIEKPYEITLEQLGLELFISAPFTLHWKKGYLFSYREQKGLCYNNTDRDIVFVHVVEDICYIKIEYHRFIELNLENATIRLIDEPEGKTNVAFFPVISTDDPVSNLVIKSILELNLEVEGE